METGVPIQLTLRWNTSADAVAYHLQVSENQDFTMLTFHLKDIHGTSREVAKLAYSTTYHWRVNAMNSQGTSDWSEKWSFNTVLAAPQLTSPLNKRNRCSHERGIGLEII